MRALIAALVLAGGASGCAPLHEPAPLRCPERCPDACPDACAPDGACLRIVVPVEAVGFERFAASSLYNVQFGPLPPSVEVDLSLAGRIDFASRAGRVPFPWGITLTVESERGFDRGHPGGYEFPIDVSFRLRRRTDPTGGLFVRIATGCDPVDTCVFEPGAAFTVEVVPGAGVPEARCR